MMESAEIWWGLILRESKRQRKGVFDSFDNNNPRNILTLSNIVADHNTVPKYLLPFTFNSPQI